MRRRSFLLALLAAPVAVIAAPLAKAIGQVQPEAPAYYNYAKYIPLDSYEAWALGYKVPWESINWAAKSTIRFENQRG